MSEPDFDAFVRTQLPRLVRYAMMLTGDRELAQDLVQDVMVKAHRRWSHIGELDRPDRYVTTMVTNAYISWRRRWSVRHIFATGVLPETADDRDGPGDEADRSEIWARLRELPRQQRAAVVLRYYEGLSDAEIAEALHCSQSTVRVHVHRALKTLRLELRELSTTIQERT